MPERKLLLATTVMVGMMIGAALPAAAQDQAVDVEELVVTGSRLPRTAFDSASPVDVVDPDTGRLEGLFDGAALLQDAPFALGSLQLGNIVSDAINNGGPGVNTISIRGLGDQRTLVLMNGRRLPPAGVGGQVGAVDLNILPQAVIRRYEVLKDGASSIYGSDAVAGVVNILTETKLDGGVLMADGTTLEAGGGSEYSLSGAYGKTFERGRLLVSAEWRHREALTYSDRSWLDCPHPYVFDPATGARNDLVDYDTGQTKCVSSSGNSVGYIPVYEAVYYGGGPFGVFYGSRTPIALAGARGPADPYLPSLRTIPIDERNYNPEVENDTTVVSPVERYTVFADGTYDLPFAQAYGEFLWSRRESEQTSYQTILQPISPASPCAVNPLSPQAYGCAGGSALEFYDPSVTYPGVPGAYHFGFAPQTRFLTPNERSQEVSVTRGLAGLRGDLPILDGWKWDAYVSYAQSEGEYFLTGIYGDRMQAVTGSALSGLPAPFCPAEIAPGCTPLNFFTDEILLSGTIPQSYLDYLQIRETGRTQYDQFIAEASISGTLFQLPAGPADAAFGVAYREEKLDDRPGPEAVAGNYWGLATAGPTKGEDSVSEAYAELRLPLLRDARFVQDLTADLSGRYSDYDSYGSSGTYKAGLNWRLSTQFRVRATTGTSFRAPALYEQFLNNQTAFLPQSSIDPCIDYGVNPNLTLRENCAADGLPVDFGGLGAAASVLIGGGDDLKAEESQAHSLGAVWTPAFAPFQLAVDYWEVEIENEVTSLAGAVVGRCYASADFPDNPLCDLFTREATGARSITGIDASYRNITSQTARGVDLTSAYARDIGPGRFEAAAQVTWTLEDSRELFPGRDDDFNGTIGNPKTVGAASVKYQWQAFTVAWSSDFIGEQSNYRYQFGDSCRPIDAYAFAGADGFAAFCAKNHAEPTWYHHLSARYEAEGWSLTGGVRNLFDEQPPFVSEALAPAMGEFSYTRLGNGPGTSQYDYLGRRFFVGVKKTF